MKSVDSLTLPAWVAWQTPPHKHAVLQKCDNKSLHKSLNAEVKKKFKHILPNVLATFLHSLFLVYSYMLFPWFPEYLQYSIAPSFYRVSHELRSLLRESVPYVKIYRYNPKHLCPKLNGYGDNGQRSLKL